MCCNAQGFGKPLTSNWSCRGSTSEASGNHGTNVIPNVYPRLCMLFISFLLSFLFGNSCKTSPVSPQRDVSIKNAQALDLRKFSKPTGHNAHHSTEQEDRGRARNLTTHVVIDWVRNFCKKLLVETFFAPNFRDFCTSKLCDWERFTRGHCIWFVVCQAKIKKRLSYAVVPITKWFFASATRIQRRKEAWQNLKDSCSPLPRSLALVKVFKSGREDRHFPPELIRTAKFVLVYSNYCNLMMCFCAQHPLFVQTCARCWQAMLLFSEAHDPDMGHLDSTQIWYLSAKCCTLIAYNISVDTVSKQCKNQMQCMCDHALYVSTLCVSNLYVSTLWVSTLCVSTLYVSTTLCEHSMC